MTNEPRPGRRLRLRARLLAGVLSITLLAFVAVDVVAATELRRYLLARTDTALRVILELAQPRVDRLLARADAGQQFPRLQHNLGGYYLAFVTDRGVTVLLPADPGLAPQLPADPAVLASGQPETVPSGDGHERLRLRALPVEGGELVAATSLEQVDQTVRRLQMIIIAASAAAVVLIGVASAIVVRLGLRPLETMAAQADRITAGDLSERVQPDDHGSEVGRLGAALNGMLSRIDTDVRQREADQRLIHQFFADASHELRNPLATLRANAELYQQGALRDPARLAKAMSHIGLEAHRMSRLVDDMLRLAHLDQSPRPLREPVDLTSLVDDCLSRARSAGPERTWRAHVDPDLAAIGDEELLQRALDNLLANVRTHTPVDTVATVTAREHDHMVVIEVSDDGPGVSAEHLPHLFQRFYRAPGQAHRYGSGLGLAIVARTAAVLGGQATAARNEPHGLRVALTLPAGSAS
jgi:two-component system OmpR family sensor kinase